MIENETIKHQLNHRAIRAFKDQTLSEEQLTTLYEVARHTATSMFMQQFSILHITDEEKRNPHNHTYAPVSLPPTAGTLASVCWSFRTIQARSSGRSAS